MALAGYNPGKMDQRITLLQPITNFDATTNDEVVTYTSAGNVRAERIFRNSTERFEANQQVGATVEEFRIRDYSTVYAITQRWRIQWNSATYNIRGIEKVGRRNYLVLTVELRDNNDASTDVFNMNAIIDCGVFDASVNLFPTTGGTGAGGSILRGNQFQVSVEGVINSIAIPEGATLQALVNNPGQTTSNWRIFF